MREITKYEMLNVKGGSFTASFLSALIKGVNSFLEVGRSIGTAIRRIYGKKVCPL